MLSPEKVPSPEEILRLDEDGADALLDHLERTVPVHRPFERIPTTSLREAIVFGDTHGDWRSVQEVERRFSAGGVPRLLVGLGDYVDRSPPDCGQGSIASALHLLSLAGHAPDRVILLQGNHETIRRLPALPHDLPEEVDALWGPDASRCTRIEALLERGPLAAVLPEGVYLAHAGFPLVGSAEEWAGAFESVDDERLAEIVWSVCDASRYRRAGVPTWGGRDLERLVRATSIRIFLRGHDPDLTGRPLYDGRCLTLHTTRVYERFGGVILVRCPLGRPVESIRDLLIEHLPTEGQTFEPVE
ncbi:MAG TPA: metallophosphoesterase [Thermoplasmata archaeon]|nr:metallophosphoesterase [Thermoplasmata archaeon]